MIEMSVMFAMIFLVATYILWSQGGLTSLLAKSDKFGDQAVLISEEHLSEGSGFGNQFLAQLQYEIEVSLFPRPTDSVLQRHYDSLVAAKLGERLEQMPS